MSAEPSGIIAAQAAESSVVADAIDGSQGLETATIPGGSGDRLGRDRVVLDRSLV